MCSDVARHSVQHQVRDICQLRTAQSHLLLSSSTYQKMNDTPYNDTPYTTPDEDPFNIQPLQPRRRRSSLLNKWIQEQQNQPPESDATPAPQDHHCSVRITPYLAYPDLILDMTTARDEILTTDGYDLLEDDDIPQSLESTLEVCLLTHFFSCFLQSNIIKSAAPLNPHQYSLSAHLETPSHSVLVPKLQPLF